MVCANRRLIHPRDDAASTGSTNAGRSKRIRISHPLARQLIDIRRNRKLVTKAPDMRAYILTGQPQNIRPCHPVWRGSENITQYEYRSPGPYCLEKAAPITDRYAHNALLRGSFFISLIFLIYILKKLYVINNLNKSNLNFQEA